MQGILNAYVYLRPRLKEQRRAESDSSLPTVVWHALFYHR